LEGNSEEKHRKCGITPAVLRLRPEKKRREK